MRGNSRNTGARVFAWDGRPRAIRVLDTGQLSQSLSLINATPIVGPDETIYAGSSNNHFFVFPVSGRSLAHPLGSIVDSAGCFVNASTLYFPCGDYSLYSLTPLPRGKATPHPLTNTVDSVSTIVRSNAMFTPGVSRYH